MLSTGACPTPPPMLSVDTVLTFIPVSSKSKLDEAEPLQRSALAIGERMLGTNHSDVATYYNNLSRWGSIPVSLSSSVSLIFFFVVDTSVFGCRILSISPSLSMSFSIYPYHIRCRYRCRYRYHCRYHYRYRFRFRFRYHYCYRYHLSLSSSLSLWVSFLLSLSFSLSLSLSLLAFVGSTSVQVSLTLDFGFCPHP